MPYQKIKREEYKNIGGINGKASVYITDQKEVLDLINLDFSQPGAWTKRWGMTNAIAGSTQVVGASNRFNFGVQTFNNPNLATYSGLFIIRNLLIGNTGVFNYDIASHLISPVVGGGSTHPLVSTPGNGNAVAIYAGYQSWGYVTAGGKMYKTVPLDGVYFYGLPNYGTSVSVGQTGIGAFTGTYNFQIAYSDGLYIGDPSVTFAYTVTGTSGAFGLIFNGLTTTNQAIQSYSQEFRIFTDREPLYPGIMQEFKTALAGATTVTATGYLNLPVELTPTENIPNSVSSILSPSTGRVDVVEYHQNRLFLGTSQGSNFIMFSEPVEFQQDAQDVRPQNIIKISNQNFPLIGLKSYNQTLMVFNQKGVTRITGDNLQNFSAYELTEEFGLVGSRAIVEWNERLWFLDENHIVEYNGANVNPVSYRVDHIIAKMNIDAAQQTACAYHYVERNEVWFAIPINGSNENNIVLVYDYIANGWTTFKSTSNFTTLTSFAMPTLSGNATLSIYMNNKQTYTAHPGGSFVYFGASFGTDNGNSITLSFKTAYHGEQGKSTTMMWRRLFLDTGAWNGITLPFLTNFYANYATSTISLTRTMYASGQLYSGPQQTRIDFGISAKSLSAEVIYGFTNPVSIFGYTIESRFLRNV